MMRSRRKKETITTLSRPTIASMATRPRRKEARKTVSNRTEAIGVAVSGVDAGVWDSVVVGTVIAEVVGDSAVAAMIVEVAAVIAEVAAAIGEVEVDSGVVEGVAEASTIEIRGAVTTAMAGVEETVLENLSAKAIGADAAVSAGVVAVALGKESLSVTTRQHKTKRSPSTIDHRHLQREEHADHGEKRRTWI